MPKTAKKTDTKTVANSPAPRDAAGPYGEPAGYRYVLVCVDHDSLGIRGTIPMVTADVAEDAVNTDRAQYPTAAQIARGVR